MEPFVDVTWVRARRGTVTLADVRWYLDGRSGRQAYEQGHLPGAVWVNLDRWLAAPASPELGRHPLPDPEVFARGMGELGIGDGRPVVAYDDAGGIVAARLVWMLRALGEPAAVLDGDLAAWPPGELEPGPAPVPQPARFTARPWPTERLAGIDELSGSLLIDARDPERYRGDHEPVDPRPGHIPGARNVPARGNLTAAGRLHDPEALRARFGVEDAGTVVAYCGSGVSACLNLLALEHAGLGTARLFPGSWSQWSADPSRPAATGPDP